MTDSMIQTPTVPYEASQMANSKVVVAGLGVSGLWAALFLATKGAAVTVSDIKPEAEIDTTILEQFRKLHVRLEAGGHNRDSFLNADMIIVSPGVPHDMGLLCRAAEKGIPVMGELEFASRLIDSPIIAVTGTNGKSTVTTLFGRLLENAGLNVFVGGNIGTPLMAYVTEVNGSKQKCDFAVLEVSSFQLDTMDMFCPFVSVILNVSPDHLDRYSSYEAYVRTKLKVFRNQGPGQSLILNDDDKELSSVKPLSGVSVFRYGAEMKAGRHAYIHENRIEACLDGTSVHAFSLDSVSLIGRHNRENMLPLVLGGLILGINPVLIQKTLDEFKGLPNRLEPVAQLGDVSFYNDSKATNVDAAVRAVDSFNQPLILIAGGRHKGADYGPLVKASKGKVKGAVFLGEAKELLAKAFEGAFPLSMAEDMDEAVSLAYSWAQKGDVVLLAPACSSFDMYSDYIHRGKAFRAAVEKVAHG